MRFSRFFTFIGTFTVLRDFFGFLRNFSRSSDAYQDFSNSNGVILCYRAFVFCSLFETFLDFPRIFVCWFLAVFWTFRNISGSFVRFSSFIHDILKFTQDWLIDFSIYLKLFEIFSELVLNILEIFRNFEIFSTFLGTFS